MVTSLRRSALPPLVYVLATFGIVSGSYGAMSAIGSVRTFTMSRDELGAVVTRSNEALSSLVEAAQLSRYDEHEADAIYGRRKAALPLAGIGLVLSCLMFAGTMRAMRGDQWGLSAWSFSAAACVPYQLLALALTLVMARDLRIGDNLPAVAMLKSHLQELFSILFCGLAVIYYGVCVLYLRTAGVKRAFSDGAGRTRPSA